MAIFKIDNKLADQLKVSYFQNEKELQLLIESNLEEIFGVRFVAREFSTGEKHGGRIDTLGIDENGSPVIIEYKWQESTNVINQGLFYLDWLVDHKGDFQLLIDKKFNNKIKVDWGLPRLLLVASSFNRYDKYAINRMAENIELWKYSLYDDKYLIIELEACSKSRTTNNQEVKRITGINYAQFGIDYHTSKTSKELQKIFNELRELILELPEVEERVEQKSGITYRTLKSFARFEFKKNSIDLLIRLSSYDDPENLIRNIASSDWGYSGLIKILPNSKTSDIFYLVNQSYEETL